MVDLSYPFRGQILSLRNNDPNHLTRYKSVSKETVTYHHSLVHTHNHVSDYHYAYIMDGWMIGRWVIFLVVRNFIENIHGTLKYIGLSTITKGKTTYEHV